MLVQELVADGDAWRMSILEIGTSQYLMMAMWPNSPGPPYGVTITEEIIITEPNLIGTFFIRGLTGEAVDAMEPGFAEAFRQAGFDPDHGQTRVHDPANQTYYLYSDSDFAEYYVDNFTGFRIQSDPWNLHKVDEETLTVYLGNGLEFSTRLGSVGAGARAGDLYMLHDSVIVPATQGYMIVLDQFHCPRLYHLRVAIHNAIQRAIAERLELAYLVAAFADVLTIASGGGDPDLAEKILTKAREAEHLERSR
jgi:hypothetical protein